MVNPYAALFYHFSNVQVAQRVSRILTDAHQDDADQETHSFEVEPGHRSQAWA
jgi:hypothetical protein